MRSRLPLNALRAFEAAARHLSFVSAADELGVTPTAVSHQIRQLEEILGAPLFRRRPRPISLTNLGAKLLPDLTHGMDKIEHAFQSVTVTKPKQFLRVTSTVAFASGVLLPNLDAWARENEDLELEIQGSDHPTSLRNDEVDLAIRYAAGPCETLVWEPLCSDQYLPMAAPNSGARGFLGPTLSSRTLVSYRWKNTNPAEPTWEKWWNTAESKVGALPALSSSKIIRISEESNALEAALTGKGVVLASEVITRDARANGKLEVLSDIALEGLSYWLVYPAAARMDDRIPRFQSWLARVLGESAERIEGEKTSSIS